MRKKQSTQLVAVMVAVAALAVIAIVPIAFSQEDMKFVPTEAFVNMERSQVAFMHDEHNEKAELDDCVVCHHGKNDDGSIDMEMSSEGESCESCHPVNPQNGETPLMRAYHRQCGDCHKESLKGPVACGECHKK